MKEYSIGQMSRRTGVKVTPIRDHESRRLIPSPARTEGGQQRYDVARLMNDRPRRTPGWNTPAEAMAEELEAIRSIVALET